ncbi:MAG: hypothetical protein M1832_004583 [Thelocarpon impressellum]|nr:MAG: hypothetical protein M1832_004583 [Thelocarpon impressellum]
MFVTASLALLGAFVLVPAGAAPVSGSAGTAATTDIGATGSNACASISALAAAASQASQANHGSQADQGPRTGQGPQGSNQSPRASQGPEANQGPQASQGPGAYQAPPAPQANENEQASRRRQVNEGPQANWGQDANQNPQLNQGAGPSQSSEANQGTQASHGPRGNQETQGNQGQEATQSPQGNPAPQSSQGPEAKQSQPPPIRVPASLAYECLLSVPIDQDSASRLVASYKQFYQFQSSLYFIKNPPDSYQMPAADIERDLDDIQARVRDGAYAGEYAFQLALYTALLRIRDGHTKYLPDALNDAFVFEKPVRLSSVSRDGLELPQIYVTERDAQVPVSAVASIDGNDVAAYVDEQANLVNCQDHDCNYNAVMSGFHWKKQPPGRPTGQYSPYPGATTTLTFANGTERAIDNVATVVADFAGVDSGAAFYARFCASKPAPPPPPMEAMMKKQPALPPPPGYPAAVVKHSHNTIAGYFLDGIHSDVAVLRVESFAPDATSESEMNPVQEFQAVVATFLARCRAEGKSKLIVDLQTNGGGVPDAEYDLFKQLFPATDPYEASMLRASPVAGAIIRSVDELRTNGGAGDTSWAEGSFFDFRRGTTADGTNFEGFDAFFGPYPYEGDSFTAVARDNLTTPAGGRATGIEISGYGGKVQNSQAPFSVENMVVVGDGVCASACISFMEQTWTGVGMSFVAVGGRPQYAPMTAGGLTKGGDVLNYSDLNNTIANITAALAATPAKLDAFQREVSLDMYALERASAASAPAINARSTVRRGQASRVPTHFLYDAAQCRVFRTARDMADAGRLWARVADAAFRGASVCVPTRPGSDGAGVPMVRRELRPAYDDAAPDSETLRRRT